jgi:hypothetical protein
MIFKGSRYENVGVMTVTDARGRATMALKIRFVPPTPAGFRHTVIASDRLDLMAYHYYRNPEKFWLIGDANDELDAEELLRQPGRQVLIPPDRGSSA